MTSVETIVSPGKRRAVVHSDDFSDAVTSACTRFRSKRVFIVVSRSLKAAHPETVSRLADALNAAGHEVVAVYDKVLPHTPGTSLTEALTLVAETNPDMFISLGGGSVVDAVRALRCAQIFGAKTVTEMSEVADRTVGWSKHLTDYYVDDLNLPPYPSRFICVVTTPSGSDFSMGGGFMDEATGIKKQFYHPGGYADVVVLDNRLMLLTPQTVWLEVGVRPVLPGVCALISNYSTHYIRRRAEAGLRDLTAGLAACRVDGADPHARELVAVGTWQCVDAVVMAKGGGLPYALSHIIGGKTGMSHGATTGITLPAYVQWCEGHLDGAGRKAAFASLREAFGETGGSAHEALRSFFRRMEMPLTLEEAGCASSLDEKTKQHMADTVFNAPIVQMGIEPRPITSEKDVRDILDLAIGRMPEAFP